MSSHTELLQKAKQSQIQQLRDSSLYSKQLAQLLSNIVASNSSNENTPVLDKITTIHQLNDNIDKQLKDGIAVNFYELMRLKRDLDGLIEKCVRFLGGGLVDKFQRRAELIDQELRVLEYTLELTEQ